MHNTTFVRFTSWSVLEGDDLHIFLWLGDNSNFISLLSMLWWNIWFIRYRFCSAVLEMYPVLILNILYSPRISWPRCFREIQICLLNNFAAGKTGFVNYCEHFQKYLYSTLTCQHKSRVQITIYRSYLMLHLNWKFWSNRLQIHRVVWSNISFASSCSN